MKYIKQNIKALILGLVIAVGASYALAADFEDPKCAPPRCNTEAPINVGSIGQNKEGSLRINSDDALAFSVPRGVSLLKDVGTYNLSVLTTGDTNVGGIVFYPRNESSLLSTSQMQLYSPSKSIFAIWDNIIKKDVLKLNNGNLELTGKIMIAGGNPGAGKILTSDASGNASWEEPGSSPTSSATVYEFVSSYYDMMQNSEFRTWFSSFTNGPTLLRPLGLDRRNDEGWTASESRITADKLCNFFTNGRSVYHTISNLGSDNNNDFYSWNPNNRAWELYTSTWNDSRDIDTVRCESASGAIVRGGALLRPIGAQNGNICTSNKYNCQ